jgi:hypothetical protein
MISSSGGDLAIAYAAPVRALASVRLTFLA